MREPKSMTGLEELGRVRLSPNFYMRDFLYSEIANFYQISNIPDDPDLAVAVGKRLCEDLLEPLQATFGRLAIRSAYRSCAVNEFGARKGLNCASNEANYAGHIWDRRDAEGRMGATACVVVPWFADRYAAGADWRALAWWIHDHLPYSSLYFHPKLAAFNINWHEAPERSIYSYIAPRGTLTKPGMPNNTGRHDQWYEHFPPLRGTMAPGPNAASSGSGRGEPGKVVPTPMNSPIDAKDAAGRAGRREPFVADASEYARFLGSYPLQRYERAMLVAHAAAEIMTATQLAAAAGWKSYAAANIRYGALGRKVAEALALAVPTRDDGAPVWTYALAASAGSGGAEWRWRIHPELVAGLRMAGMIRS